jgi:putative membrane protein
VAIGVGAIVTAAAATAAGGVSTEDVLNQLHRSNLNEIAMGKLAEKNGQSKQVKSFGQMLVKDHQAADTKVLALASQEKLTLKDVPPMKHDTKDGMGGIPAGPGFDAKFAQDMLEDHRKDIAMVTRARDDTSDAKLKKLLTELLPVLEKHEQTAQKILDSQSKSASR